MDRILVLLTCIVGGLCIDVGEKIRMVLDKVFWVMFTVSLLITLFG